MRAAGVTSREGARWVAQRRLRSQLLDRSRADSAEGVVSHLTAVQSQDHLSARWSVAQRTRGAPSAADLDRAFDEGRILRTHVLRPTWHYVTPDDLRWLLRLRGPGLDAANAGRHQSLGLDARALARSSDVIAGAVADAPRTRHEIADALEAKNLSPADQRLGAMLMHAELTAVICSGPMRGRQHTYAAFDSRVPDDAGPEGDDALAQLARRFFTARGPATVADLAWWSGVGMRAARRGLDLVQSELARVDVDGIAFHHDGGRGAARSPVVALAPCFDEIFIAYSQSRDVVHEGAGPFPIPGYVDGFRHVIVLDGRAVGHWRPDHRDPTSVETRTTRPLSASERHSLEGEIARYGAFAATAATSSGRAPRPRR